MNYYYHIIIVYVDFSCSNINYARKQTMRCYIYGIFYIYPVVFIIFVTQIRRDIPRLTLFAIIVCTIIIA